MGILRSIKIMMIAVLFTSSTTQANEALLSHLHHVSQAMSALYMHGLSEGNEKYQKEFEQYKYNALISLKTYFSQGGPDSSDLLKRWQALSGNLNLKYSEDFGWDLSPYPLVRFELRSYHSDIYKLMEKNKDNYTSYDQKLKLAKTQIEAVSARFYDIASTYDGAESLSNADFDKLNSKLVSQEVKGTLDNLTNEAPDSVSQGNLKSIKFKWEFVEESVTDHQNQSAYFLVYATKNNINNAFKGILTKAN